MTVLYNCHTDGDEYRITKFTDGNPESSYLTSLTECQCPAGSRPTCRHRQMLPKMIAEEIVNKHWFWDFDRDMAVDFQGRPAGLLTQPVPEAPHSEPTIAIFIELPADANVAEEFSKLLHPTPSPAPFRRRI